MSAPIDFDHLLTGLTDAAKAAGAAAMTHYGSDLLVEKKGDESPVTAADKDAEAAILKALETLAPTVPVISEEQHAAGIIPDVDAQFFLVDPLDGTKEFINRNGEFTINVALIEHGFPVLGVVYAPAKERMFFGSKTKGAFEQHVPYEDGNAAGEPRRLTVRTPPEDGLTVVASRSHRDQKTEEYLNLYKVKEFLAAGSSLKFCLVAAGEADLYPRHGRTMEWDTAAGHAVLAAAGGTVTQLDGTPLLYGKKDRGFDNPYFVARGAAPAS